MKINKSMIIESAAYLMINGIYPSSRLIGADLLCRNSSIFYHCKNMSEIIEDALDFIRLDIYSGIAGDIDTVESFIEFMQDHKVILRCHFDIQIEIGESPINRLIVRILSEIESIDRPIVNRLVTVINGYLARGYGDFDVHKEIGYYHA